MVSDLMSSNPLCLSVWLKSPEPSALAGLLPAQDAQKSKPLVIAGVKGWNSIEIERRSKYPLRDQNFVKLVESLSSRGLCSAVYQLRRR
jgi:hypothetical protein